MNTKNIKYFTTNLTRAIKIVNELQQKYNILPLSNQNECSSIETIIVIGDDGVFLQALKNFLHLKVGFYGINVGNLGFLMNSYNCKHDLIEQIYFAKQSLLIHYKQRYLIMMVLKKKSVSLLTSALF
ncbi:ATP-NAD kinase family protein [Orientia chuto str. Dubai]|uniref:ATP-NAD kinase family protein n=1 Tax=Orientia chuto str. Dubai TaxID=1359168 RepID=A0A0F3MLB4_9RICK|nr:NAD(+)/NADH kinase [Candidatus Orientia mediorientalis]KJV55389.1 ATP-NAD kinase family protein [Orientia chuto str. Dubai]